MRNIHAQINSEYGQENVENFRCWEKLEYKMADFSNHRRFSLRCLSEGLIPVSVRLKSNIKTPKGRQIIKKAELALLNERVRSINNSITMFTMRRDTCMKQLKDNIDKETMDRCLRFIKEKREKRHLITFERQVKKFNRLCHRITGGCINNQHVLRPDTVHEQDQLVTITASEELTFDRSRSRLDTQNKNNWVRNLSKMPLTDVEERLLAHGPNFSVVPKEPPILEYITAIEKSCSQLQQGKVEELRGEIKSILKKISNSRPYKSNITKEEQQAIRKLKKDENRMVLTADKGVSLLVVDKEDYIKKAKHLLHQSNYKKINSDPTNKHKNKLIGLLKTIKTQGGMNDNLYKRLYPTGANAPKFYGLPKVHKDDTPLRPIVSSVGSVSYETAKELSRILKPLVGKTEHHVKNAKDFIDSIQDIRLKPNECLVSYDVEALFTSVPIQAALNITKKKLEEDKELHLRTSMSVQHISWLLEFCLRTTYFLFQGEFHQQLEGTAMGSPISPIIANLFLEDLEAKALSTSPHPPSMWKRYVDDTLTIINRDHKDAFLDHLNSIDDNIRFTSEDPKEDGSISFLDILIIPDANGKLNTTVYRKPTHTDMYLHWDSHHNIPAKYSVIGTLYHRANTICSTTQYLQNEERHLNQALMKCKYPQWAINRVKLRARTTTSHNSNRRTGSYNTAQPNKPNINIVVPYHQGLSESIKRTCSKYGIQVHCKGGHTIKNLLMASKDKDHILNKSGIIYRYKCHRVECDEEYIGESARTFSERFKEHLKPPSPIYDHSNISGHNVTIDNFSIVGREDHNIKRAIKEALYIRSNNPSLNKNIGKYHLPHIWDEVLVNITELQLS